MNTTSSGFECRASFKEEWESKHGQIITTPSACAYGDFHLPVTLLLHLVLLLRAFTPKWKCGRFIMADVCTYICGIMAKRGKGHWTLGIALWWRPGPTEREVERPGRFTASGAVMTAQRSILGFSARPFVQYPHLLVCSVPSKILDMRGVAE